MDPLDSWIDWKVSDPVALPLALLTLDIRARRVRLTTSSAVPRPTAFREAPHLTAYPEAPTAHYRRDTRDTRDIRDIRDIRDTRGRTTDPLRRRTILLRRPFLSPTTGSTR